MKKLLKIFSPKISEGDLVICKDRRHSVSGIHNNILILDNRAYVPAREVKKDTRAMLKRFIKNFNTL